MKNKEWNGKWHDTVNNIIYELKEGKGFVKRFYRGNLVYEGNIVNGE